VKQILVIGSLNMDFVVSVEEMPRKGETISAKNMQLIGGGKGANQACAAGKLGAPTAMLGAVGKDTYGDRLLDSLKQAGVDVSRILRLEEETTGIALITVDSHGENSITVIPGANGAVSCEYIERNRDLIAASDYVLLQLEIPMETVVYAAKLAHEMGKTVILDPAPAPDHLPDELFQYVDLLKPNETELEKLSGIPVNEETLKSAAETMKHKGVPCVIVTLGGEGMYGSFPDGSECRLYTQKVPVVDTTAAGDSFTGALAAAMGEGASVLEAMDYAGKVAAVVVTRKGAQTSLPTKEEVEAFYRNTSL
jgi:ribokinase